MSPDRHETCRTMVRAAAAGDRTARSVLVRNDTAPIRAHLGHRWRDSSQVDAIDGAAQDVFVEGIEPGGALEAGAVSEVTEGNP